MATWKYGPYIVKESDGWYSEWETSMELLYQTTADSMVISITENNQKQTISLSYESAQVFAKMVSKWLLEYEGVDEVSRAMAEKFHKQLEIYKSNREEE